MGIFQSHWKEKECECENCTNDFNYTHESPAEDKPSKKIPEDYKEFDNEVTAYVDKYHSNLDDTEKFMLKNSIQRLRII